MGGARKKETRRPEFTRLRVIDQKCGNRLDRGQPTFSQVTGETVVCPWFVASAYSSALVLTTFLPR
jgi:hypothetical protein